LHADLSGVFVYQAGALKCKTGYSRLTLSDVSAAYGARGETSLP
jgi:hypothetical protein